MAHVRNRVRTLPRYESRDRTRGRTACTELTCTTVPGRYGTASPVKAKGGHFEEAKAKPAKALKRTIKKVMKKK